MNINTTTTAAELSTISLGPPQQMAHVFAYQRVLLQKLRDQRRVRETAERYDAAVAAEPDRVKLINDGQAQVIEPVRFKRDVERQSWIDPEQRNKFSKTPEKVVGFRRIDALVRLQRGGTINERHLAAAIKLRDDFEIGDGARPGCDRVVAGGQGQNPGGPTDRQIDAMARYRAAVQAVGKTLSGILLHVVLENRTVKDWAEKRSRSLNSSTGYFVAAMDRLLDHYGDDLTHDDLERTAYA